MIFDCINGRNANERSLTYTPLLGWEGASEPKGRGSNRTTQRWWEFAQANIRPPPESWQELTSQT